MLAILQIKMEWTKENRTLEGSIQRQKYYKPVKIEEDVNLSGEGIFMKKCNYYQKGDSVLSNIDISKNLDKQIYEENIGKAFTGEKEYEYRKAGQRNNSIKKTKGAFYSIDKIDIPCIKIIEQEDCSYRIKWFDCEMGMPRRRGGNEDLYNKDTKLAGRLNLLNETAFILKEGEAGMLKYNYRKTYYDGQWYECYYVYMVNTKNLNNDIFIRNYDFEYNQLADLF